MSNRRRRSFVAILGAVVGISILQLGLEACHRVVVEPWERIPVLSGAVIGENIANGPVFHVDRVRFQSAHMQDARYFLAVVPNGPEPIEAVAIINHGFTVGGFSFGGHIALDVANRYSNRVESASVVSSFFERTWTFWAGHPAAGPDGRLGAGGNDGRLHPRLLLACGTSDRFYPEMTTLHNLFTASGITHEWVTGSGGHTWAYWSTVVARMLKFQIGTGGQSRSRP